MQNKSTPALTEIISNFCIEGEISGVELYGSGHINETYYLKNSNEKYSDYLLQRINHHVFKDVPALMENIRKVTEHLRKKLEKTSDANADKKVLTLVPTKNKLFFYCDMDGNYWRIYYFLHSNNYDLLQTEQQAFECGKAFGRFQAMLADMDAKLLAESIPNFHNIEMRLDNFDKAIQEDILNRVKEVEYEIAFLCERMDAMKEILMLGKAGRIPLRIIHNDTKLNNVLLDKNDHEQCVIDLDTVMPGYVAYDFGDAIRTIINTAAEDEKDLGKINLNIPFFKAYAEGYFKEAAIFLTDMEIESLLKGVLLIPYEQTVRFLTDYIEGDTYYKIHFPEHNLQRTRAQLQLLKKLEAEYETLKEIMQNVVKDDHTSA
jgi:thiamine kinase-like enzyme